MRLFRRAYRLIVDDLDVTGLDIQFHVSKTTKPEPNKAQIKIFNLSPDHIQQLTKRAKAKDSSGIRVELSAGYVDDVPLIFRGDVRDIATDHNGADTITTIAGHDGGRAYREARINIGYGPGTAIETILRDCAKALTVGEGNISDVARTGTIKALGRAFPHGVVLSGRASQQLDRVVKAIGCTWSIQNGVLQLQQGGAALQASAIRLAADSGLVGSPATEIDASVAQPSPDAATKPTASKPKKPKTVLACKALMIPGLTPGRKVALESQDYNGTYQIMQDDYVGDTAGNDWHSNLKLKVVT